MSYFVSPKISQQNTLQKKIGNSQHPQNKRARILLVNKTQATGHGNFSSGSKVDIFVKNSNSKFIRQHQTPITFETHKHV